MLLLTSVADLISIVTDTATNLDVHASWLDYQSATGVESVTPGRTNTLITTATTTTIIGSPSDATTYRNVKTITIRNRDASSSNTITIRHYDGTSTIELIKVMLSAGEELHYADRAGWFKLASNTGAILTTISPSLFVVKIDFSGGGDNTTIASSPSKIVKVYRLMLTVAGATLITFKDGATALSGAIDLIAVGSSITMTDEGEPHFYTTAGNAFVINSSNAVQVSGSIWYTKN